MLCSQRDILHALHAVLVVQIQELWAGIEHGPIKLC